MQGPQRFKTVLHCNKSTTTTMGGTEIEEKDHAVLNKARLARMTAKAMGIKEDQVELLESSVRKLSAGQNYSGQIFFCDLKAKDKSGGGESSFSWAVKLPPLYAPEKMVWIRESKMEEKEIK